MNTDFETAAGLMLTYLGEDAALSPVEGGGPHTIKVKLSQELVRQIDGFESRIVGYEKIMVVALSEMPDTHIKLVKNDTLVLDSVTYTVMGEHSNNGYIQRVFVR